MQANFREHTLVAYPDLPPVSRNYEHVRASTRAGGYLHNLSRLVCAADLSVYVDSLFDRKDFIRFVFHQNPDSGQEKLHKVVFMENVRPPFTSVQEGRRRQVSSTINFDFQCVNRVMAKWIVHLGGLLNASIAAFTESSLAELSSTRCNFIFERNCQPTNSQNCDGVTVRTSIVFLDIKMDDYIQTALQLDLLGSIRSPGSTQTRDFTSLDQWNPMGTDARVAMISSIPLNDLAYSNSDIKVLNSSFNVGKMDHTNLTKKTKSVRCIFHDDRTPSAVLSFVFHPWKKLKKDIYTEEQQKILENKVEEQHCHINGSVVILYYCTSFCFSCRSTTTLDKENISKVLREL